MRCPPWQGAQDPLLGTLVLVPGAAGLIFSPQQGDLGPCGVNFLFETVLICISSWPQTCNLPDLDAGTPVLHHTKLTGNSSSEGLPPVPCAGLAIHALGIHPNMLCLNPKQLT